MPNLLHIDSSLRTDASRSRKLTAHYADAWRAVNPGGTVTYRDVAANPIPHIDEAAFTANFVGPDDRTPEQRAGRAVTEELVQELLDADEIVVGMGLYNYNVPSTVKAWFDRLVVPGLTVGDDGGLLGGRALTFVLASGGGYGAGAPREGWDHREPWLTHAFSPLGLEPRFVRAELTLARESPAMIPLDLGAAEDQSYSEAVARIDALVAPVAVPVGG